jgi:LAO/AO transport system kinase
VVLVPGMGDEIQAIKAGIMEVADLFVINKADREGADQVERELEAMKSLAMPSGWDPPIQRTIAQQGTGIPELLARIRAHGQWLRDHGGLAQKAQERARLRFESLLAEAALRRAKEQAGPARLEAVVQGIANRTLDPYTAVGSILGEV